MLPDWAGGCHQPLRLADAALTIDRVSLACITLARKLMTPASGPQLVAAEFSRWLGVAAAQLLAVGPHPKPELMSTASDAHGTLDDFAELATKHQVEELLTVVAALAADTGWGNRNLALTARQLHGDLLWWKLESNLWAVLE
jgi:hypothetical protein